MVSVRCEDVGEELKVPSTRFPSEESVGWVKVGAFVAASSALSHLLTPYAALMLFMSLFVRESSNAIFTLTFDEFGVKVGEHNGSFVVGVS